MGKTKRTLSNSEIIELYAGVARPIMLKYMPPNSCVSATRITIETLKLFSVDAVPAPTKFCVANLDSGKAYTSGLSEEEIEQAANVTASPWRGEWRGHLVAVADRRWLIDPTFDQALLALGLPANGCTTNVVRVPKNIDPNRIHAVLKGAANNGTPIEVEYISTGNHSYQDSEAWNDAGVPVLTEIIKAAMLEALKG